MKLTTIALAAFVAPLSQAASIPHSELITRQTKSRELSQSSKHPSQYNTRFPRTNSNKTVDPTLYPLLQRYTRFAAASQGAFYYHDKACPRPPFQSSLIRVIESPNPHTASIYLFTQDSSKELILSFASLASIHDPSIDSSFSLIPLTTSPGCTGCQVHTSILNIWTGLQPTLSKTLSELQPILPDYKTIIVGHSLGGSLASLAYTELKSNGVPVEKAYTMGALRVGNQAYADFTDRLAGASDVQLGDLIRITHGADSLPNLPSKNADFQHTRTEIYEVDTTPNSDEQSAGTTFRCFGQEAQDCIKGNAVAKNGFDHSKYTGVLMVDEVECNHRT
ncbi:hypothetical protein yc1106_08987 [Curvularia clavata]|uniref:Fungal lipase-type domain-containing protein n=1 Tax=Curvularia clavata TaxID=95742 RepID=A0A9Q9DV33_CURCL|nr:hypothetical protein yc1106_08987 [Curvularia clavata]